MLANRPRSFHNTSLIETSLSDCHKMIVSVFRDFSKRLPAKVIEHRNYKTFDQNQFLRNLDQELIKSNSYNDEQQSDIFTSKNICNSLNKKAKKDYFKGLRRMEL